jgi:hypothetical protein
MRNKGVRNMHCYKDYSKWSSALENYSPGSRKRPLFVPEHFVFDIPQCRKYLPASGAGHSAVLMQEDSVKALKIKMTGKTAAWDSLQRRSITLKCSPKQSTGQNGVVTYLIVADTK